MDQYQAAYYEGNQQNQDRIGLLFFARLVKRYIKTGRLLDYGCGTGFFLKKFDPKLFELYLYDISEYARSAAKALNPTAQVLVNPHDNIADDHLDCICSLHTLEHIEDPLETLKMFYKKLRKHGVLFFVVPNQLSLGKKLKQKNWFAYRDPTHISLLTMREWVDITVKAGFTIQKIGSDGLWDVPYFTKVPLFLQKLLFFPGAAIQLLFGQLFFPLAWGENLIIIAKKC